VVIQKPQKFRVPKFRNPTKVTSVEKKLERLGVKKRSLSRPTKKTRQTRRLSMEKNVINIMTTTPDQDTRKEDLSFIALRDAVSFLNEPVPESIEKVIHGRRVSTDLDEVADRDEISFVLSQSPNTRSRKRIS
jgi:hypothetical protein